LQALPASVCSSTPQLAPLRTRAATRRNALVIALIGGRIDLAFAGAPDFLVLIAEPVQDAKVPVALGAKQAVQAGDCDAVNLGAFQIVQDLLHLLVIERRGAANADQLQSAVETQVELDLELDHVRSLPCHVLSVSGNPQ